MPWSLVAFLADDGIDGDLASAAAYYALAVMNAVLLLCLARAMNRRRSR